ncbi:MAG: ABC transporter permease subunit, partial [Chloroflexi bacterium]|nr:ABC transporter permease subunit [Chloroflexota bacterium]
MSLEKGSLRQLNGPFPRGWLSGRLASPGDGIFRGLAIVSALGMVGLLLAMVGLLLEAAWPAISRFGAVFLSSSAWDPVRDQFGALPAIYGTLVSSAIAMVISMPLSMGVAIFLVELAPRWFRSFASFIVEMLAAIPSVVLGLWALFVMVPVVRDPIERWLGSALGFLPVFQGPPLGVGFLAGGMILTVMTLPIITAVTREALAAVPSSQREAMLALGAT